MHIFDVSIRDYHLLEYFSYLGSLVLSRPHYNVFTFHRTKKTENIYIFYLFRNIIFAALSINLPIIKLLVANPSTRTNSKILGNAYVLLYFYKSFCPTAECSDVPPPTSLPAPKSYQPPTPPALPPWQRKQQQKQETSTKPWKPITGTI